MNKAFKEALEQGLVEPVTNFNGGPLVIKNQQGTPVQYYQATGGGINMLMGRFHSFSDILRKHDALKLTDELLALALKTIRDMQRVALSQFNVDPDQALDAIRETMTIVDRLEQRRELGVDMTQLFEIASVWYFSEEENPGVVDNQLNRTKVADWLRSEQYAELVLFFSQTHLVKFVPLNRLLETATLSYIQNLNQLELLDWARIRLLKERLGMTNDTTSTIESRMETLYDYDGLTNALLSRTTI